MSFAAAANQRVQIETSNNTYSNPIPVTLYGPDGTTVVASWTGDYLLDTTRLGASAGTYYLKFDAAGVDEGSVSVQVWSVPEDIDYGALNLNGTPKTFTTVGGQNASATFQVTTVGQKIQIESSGSTYDPTPEGLPDPSRMARTDDQLVRQRHADDADLQHDRHLEDPGRPPGPLGRLDQRHRDSMCD